MRKIILGALATLLLVAGAFGAQAAPGENNGKAGPNGSNDKGLCTAYFNGQKNGHDKQREDGSYPGPFAGLEEAGNAYTDSDRVDNDRDGEVDEEGEHTSLSPAENIFNFCDNTTEIGGNPEHGRFTCTASGDDSDPDCEENPAPGNS